MEFADKKELNDLRALEEFKNQQKLTDQNKKQFTYKEESEKFSKMSKPKKDYLLEDITQWLKDKERQKSWTEFEE
jgi:hypothetical protein